MVVLRNYVKRLEGRYASERAYYAHKSAEQPHGEIYHLSIAPNKEGGAIIQLQMPFRAILRSWTLLPSHKLLPISLLKLKEVLINVKCEQNVFYNWIYIAYELDHLRRLSIAMTIIYA